MSKRPTPAEEAEALRAATREAHEALKDMRAVMRDLVALKAEVETVAATVFGERMDAQVKAGLDEYAEAIAKATEEATQAVYKRFDSITDILLGETGSARRAGEPTLAELAQARTEARS